MATTAQQQQPPDRYWEPLAHRCQHPSGRRPQWDVGTHGGAAAPQVVPRWRSWWLDDVTTVVDVTADPTPLRSDSALGAHRPDPGASAPWIPRRSLPQHAHTPPAPQVWLPS